MARRKKEPVEIHRSRIADAASALFLENGITAVSMDEIAKTSGYSKPTLYVYFKNKAEIVSVLTLDSMKKLFACLSLAVNEGTCTKEQYYGICRSLVQYQEEFPFYFQTALDHINTDIQSADCPPQDKETAKIGEAINGLLEQFLMAGMENGDFRKNLEIIPTIFHFWGMLAGLILLASKKEDYIKMSVGLSKQEFLEQGFDLLYRSVEAMQERRWRNQDE